MNQNTQGRIDLLLLRLAERGVRGYVEPAFRNQVTLWDSGLNRLVADRLRAMGIPDQPVSQVRIGNLLVPVDVLRVIGQICGLLPGKEIPRADP